ncbi:MAG: virulence protein RhuM/Fic/DOC family protein [Bacteroidales bacterium]|nr:virulence protein RhuM/Fic/DOC family protein [Bacteroidales bacterium]
MEKITTKNSQLAIYQAPDGDISIDVTVQNDTVWLSQNQMAELFEKDQSVITRHISNIFKEHELEQESNMQILHNTLSKYKPTRVYSLDVIISVGYRVKSKRGTQFRIWANKVLRQYLLNGYVIHENIAIQKYEALSRLVKVLGRTIQNQAKPTEASRSLLEIVVDYTYALDTLDRYDYQELKIEETTSRETFHISYDSAIKVIRELHEKFGVSELFGNEKDESFKSSIGQIYQTFDGKDLYSSVEEKAAVLLYLIVKNHSFSDGNKRIAATIFLWFLYGNGILYNKDGTKRIADNMLVALTLMIAESRAEEKDLIIRVIINLINKNN